MVAPFSEGLTEEMLWNNWSSNAEHNGCMRTRQCKLNGVIVDLLILHGLAVDKEAAHGVGTDIHIVDYVKGKDDVVSSKLFTVMPLYAAAQIEGNFCTIFTDFVVTGQFRHNQAGVTMQCDQAFKDTVSYISTGCLCCPMRVECLRTGSTGCNRHSSAVLADSAAQIIYNVEDTRIFQFHCTG